MTSNGLNSQTETKPRECGYCQLCCTALEVKPLNKPSLRSCEHQLASTSCSGCGIYGTPERPEGCSGFRCLWLLGFFSNQDQPHRSKVLFEFYTTIQGKPVIRALEVVPGAWDNPRVQKCSEILEEKGVTVIVVLFDGRKLVRTRDVAVGQILGKITLDQGGLGDGRNFSV